MNLKWNWGGALAAAGLFVMASAHAQTAVQPTNTLKLGSIRMRDVCILPDQASKTYFMVFCHEWVQIKDGTVEYVRLKDDLSATDGEPKRLFNGSDAVWSKKSDQYGCHVTDGPYLYKGRSGKLFMVWTSGGYTGYTEGIAISDSGKLAGPWKQQVEPIFAQGGGHGMLFTTFDGRLMNVLHSPNGLGARPRIFEMEDTGDTLRILKEFTGESP